MARRKDGECWFRFDGPLGYEFAYDLKGDERGWDVWRISAMVTEYTYSKILGIRSHKDDVHFLSLGIKITRNGLALESDRVVGCFDAFEEKLFRKELISQLYQSVEVIGDQRLKSVVAAYSEKLDEKYGAEYEAARERERKQGCVCGTIWKMDLRKKEAMDKLSDIALMLGVSFNTSGSRNKSPKWGWFRDDNLKSKK